jgi:iron complex outermembrane receptor protein
VQRFPSFAGRALGVVLPCAIALAAPARAEQTEAPNGAEPAEVVVRAPAPPRSASETELDAATLQAAPHRNASELMQTVPGVYVSQHSGEGKAHQIFFRGFDAVHGQDVEVWAGGVPVNEVSNLHGQGYTDLHFLIPEVVRTLRSQPGNYDPRQGDFAVAGSLGFELGYDEPGITTKVGLGSHGARRLFLGYRPRGGDGSTFGAFELHSTDGFGPARAARHASGIAQVAGALGKGWQGRALATSYASRFESAGVLRLDDVDSGSVDRFATYDPNQGGVSLRTSLVLELAHVDERGDGEPTRLLLSPFFVLRGLTLRSNFTGFLTSPEGDSMEQKNDTTTAGARASYRYPVSLLSRHDALEAGLFFRNDSIHQQQHRISLRTGQLTDDTQTPGVDADVIGTNVAGYVDAALHPISRVTLRGGFRADGLAFVTRDRGSNAGATRSAFGGHVSKRGSLEVVTLPGLRAVASYGEGFRSPEARMLAGGQSLSLTEVRSFELGGRYDGRSGFQASLAGFHTRLSDDDVFDHATRTSVEVPATSRTGVAASVAVELARRFVSRASFTFVRAVFERSGAGYREGQALPYVPGIVARTDLAYTPLLAVIGGRHLRGHFGAGTTYLGHRPLPYSEWGRDLFLLDASASLRYGPVSAGVEALNLLDADWFDGEFVYPSAFGASASRVPVRHVTVGPPRTVLFNLAVFL